MPVDSEKPLPFDMAERLAALEAGIESVVAGSGGGKARLLDVGGAPGVFARHLQQRHSAWSITIADLYECHAERYVFGSGLALPFLDNAFDIAYCCDVLEHVPESGRPRFLSELKRVARGGVVVAAPFRHSNVDTAESILDNLHKEILGGRHPWLREHRDNGLPDLATTAAEFGQSTALSLSPNADLERWFLLQAIEILSQVLPGARDAWRAFQEPLGALWNDPVAPIATVPYRWVLASSLSDAASASSRQEAGSSPPKRDVAGAGALDAYPYVASLDARFEALAGLARGLAAGWQAYAGGGEAGKAAGTTMANDELIERLAAIVEFLEAHPPSPGASSGSSTRTRSLLDRALRRIRGGS